MQNELGRKPWVRLYREGLHNPKIVTLSDRQHRVWHNCLLMADDAGSLPTMRDIACHLRMNIPDAEQVIFELVEVGLVDVDNLRGARTFKMHDWSVHQYVSDSSVERTRKYRKRKKKITSDGDVTSQVTAGDANVTPPDTDTDTDTEIITSVEQEAAREKKVFLNDLLLKRGRGVPPRLKAKAEGLGLPVADIELQATGNHVKNPSGMFRHLCVEHVKRLVPWADDATVKAAFSESNEGAYATVCNLLLEATP